MSNNLDLYKELRKLQMVVDEKLYKKLLDKYQIEKTDSSVESLKRWIFHWFN